MSLPPPAPPTPESLLRDAHLLVRVPHEELMLFIREWSRGRRSWLTFAHRFLTFASCAAIGGSLLWSKHAALQNFTQMVAAVPALLFVVLPLHEGLHDVAYRLAGARDVRWTFAWRHGVAYVAAHRFVATARALTAVALAPFVVLTMTLLFGAWLWSRAIVFAMSLLALHTAACVGDLAMMNFCWHHRDRKVVTFDDADENATYFYAL